MDLGICYDLASLYRSNRESPRSGRREDRVTRRTPPDMEIRRTAPDGYTNSNDTDDKRSQMSIKCPDVEQPDVDDTDVEEGATIQPYAVCPDGNKVCIRSRCPG